MAESGGSNTTRDSCGWGGTAGRDDARGGPGNVHSGRRRGCHICSRARRGPSCVHRCSVVFPRTAAPRPRTGDRTAAILPRSADVPGLSQKDGHSERQATLGRGQEYEEASRWAARGWGCHARQVRSRQSRANVLPQLGDPMPLQDRWIPLGNLPMGCGHGTSSAAIQAQVGLRPAGVRPSATSIRSAAAFGWHGVRDV